MSHTEKGRPSSALRDLAAELVGIVKEHDAYVKANSSDEHSNQTRSDRLKSTNTFS
jgi:hypothetical protein